MEVREIFETMNYGPAPESNDKVLAFLETKGGKFDLFINGEWRAPKKKKYFDVHNPATGELLAKVGEASKGDVDAAVSAARDALPEWVGLGPHGRAKFLYAIARHLQKHARLFSVLETMDNGKPIRESRDIDIPLVARHFYHHAGWAQLRDSALPDYREIGVVGQVIPWNFPLLMLAWKIAPALAMGNTVVIKPAEYTPLTAFAFAEICANINLPPGVVNVISGDGQTGALLVEHEGVDKVAFTGSTDVGKIIRRATAGSGKKLSLELGGKSPFIVFEDADLDSVVEGVVDAIWFNQGQVCCAGSRLLIQESIADTLIQRLRVRMEKLRVGNPLDKSIDIGAIVAPVQLTRIQELVAQGVSEGALLWQPSWACPTEGLFYPPTLFTNVQPSSTIAQEEIFGPVLVSMTFRTPEEAVKLANNTRFGLAASVWTENVNLALDIAPKLVAGTVWVNCTNQFDAAAGFGGYRESGFGREGGIEGLYEYVKPRFEDSLSEEPLLSPKAPESKEASSGLGFEISMDRTAKMYIGGKQARPDSGYSLNVLDPMGKALGEVGLGNRKDIRNAVEAAHAGSAWRSASGHNRAQVLYFIAENLSARAREFAERISAMTGASRTAAENEVATSISRVYTWAAHCDKYDGRVHQVPSRCVTLAMPEPLGVMAVICPTEQPLLGFISTVIPALALGNRIIAVPSEVHPLSATDFYQVLDTSDLPDGALNIVTGNREELTKALASHDDVDGIWYFGSAAGSREVELLSADNMKRTWVNYGKHLDWYNPIQAEGEHFLRRASQIKNIWVPYGE